MRKSKGECTLIGLAKRLNIPNADAHNATQDVIMLEKVIKHAKIEYGILSESAINYGESKSKWDLDKLVQSRLPLLQPLQNVTVTKFAKDWPKPI